MTTQTLGQCAQNPAIVAETRFVTIPACSNHSGLLTVTVKLHWTCPGCGGPRGETFRTQSYDGALPVHCDGWNNPCGHVDLYQHVRLEAESNGLNETAKNTAVDAPRATIIHFQPKRQDDAVNDFLDELSVAYVSLNQAAAVNDFMAQIRVQEIERETVLAAGVPALHRLAKISQRDTGQAATVRLFLLGLYNSYRFPFKLTDLRGLDRDLFNDCMDVLTMDARATVKEVHQYFVNGGQLFEQFAEIATEARS